MPTYEYRCPDGHDFEKFVLKMSDAKSELACPICGKAAERRVSAGSGFLFKGSGFYITDYGKDGKKDQRAAAAKAEGAASTAASTPAATGATSSAASTTPATTTTGATKSEPSTKSNPTPKSGPEK